MTDYDLTPADSSTPQVRFYGDSMDPIRRGQNHPTESHAAILGAEPGADSDGLEPGELRLSGTWLGSDAATLADRLRSIVNDPAITEVELEAVNESSPVDGTYIFNAEDVVEQVVPGRDDAWQYRFRLTEK